MTFDADSILSTVCIIVLDVAGDIGPTVDVASGTASVVSLVVSSGAERTPDMLCQSYLPIPPAMPDASVLTEHPTPLLQLEFTILRSTLALYASPVE